MYTVKQNNELCRYEYECWIFSDGYIAKLSLYTVQFWSKYIVSYKLWVYLLKHEIYGLNNDILKVK